MSSPHLTLLTEPQVDIPGSPFFLSPIYLHSPQPSPISPLITQSPVADPNFFWYENLYDTTVFLPKLDQGGISPSLLDGDVVEHFPVSPNICSKSLNRPERLLTPDPCSRILHTLLRRSTSSNRATHR